VLDCGLIGAAAEKHSKHKVLEFRCGAPIWCARVPGSMQA